jgi:hypothetical protein
MLLLSFAIAAACTVINTMLIAWIASRFLDESKAKIAGFSFMLGGACFGWPGRSGTADAFVGDYIALVGGFVTGLAFVWLQFFGKRRHRV